MVKTSLQVLKAQFDVNKITSNTTKFSHTLVKIPTNILDKVSDLSDLVLKSRDYEQ